MSNYPGTMDNRVGSQEDLLFGQFGQNTSWRDWRNWNGRQKIFAGIAVGTGVALLFSVIAFTIILSSSGAAVIVPTTPTTPTTELPTTSTTPSTTTTFPTTTSTTPATTTTSTTPASTTTSTTPAPTTTSTTPAPTTTSTTPAPTTTSTTPAPTTTSTTPVPTTTSTTSVPTTTSTTPEPTTTTSKPTPSNTTTSSPPFHPSTSRPIPEDWAGKSPISLLNEVGIKTNFTYIPCKLHTNPTYKCQLIIEDTHSYFGEGSSKQDAKIVAAINANEEMFGIKYPNSVHPHPPFSPCVPVEPASSTELSLETDI